MERIPLDNDPADPFLPLDWRWRRAAVLLDHGELFTVADDYAVREAAAFLRAWRSCQDEVDRPRLALDMPALYGAHRLSRAADAFAKWEVEARLLTDEPYARIAEKCGRETQVIKAYHETFFCVRDRLQAEGYVLHQVIGPKAHAGLTEADVDVILKLYAYAGGPLVVDALASYYRDSPTLPDRPELLGAAELQELRTKLLLKASILAHTLPANASGLKKMAVLSEAVQVLRTTLRKDCGPDNPLLGPLQVKLDGPHCFAAQTSQVVLANPPLAARLEPLSAA
jgi:hypothetical protein